MKKSINIGNHLAPWGLAAVLLLLWEGVVKWATVPDWILPGPLQIGRTFLETLPLMMQHTRSTLIECLAGFGAAIVLAAAMAFLMDELPLVKQAVYPLVIISQTVPIISVAPLFIIWFGYSLLPKILVVVLVCFFPITVSLLGGLAAVDREYLELFRSMKASRLDTLRLVKLPLALPAFFSGLRISATYSVMGAVIGEWLGAKEGLGTYMTLAQHSFQVDRVFAAILVITGLSLLLVAAIGLLERLIIPWHRLSN